jgi:CBS domain-containing protein
MTIESIRVSNFMTRNVKTETEDQNIQAVCKTMNENNIGSVIVMTPPYDYNQKPVGIITERDVVRVIGQLYPSLLHLPIKEFMSKPLITLSTNSSIKDAMQTMQQNNIRRVPIVEKETIQGIVTDKDVFRAIMDNRIPLDNLVSGAALVEGHRLVFDQCRDYFFNDILRRG